MKHTEYIIPIGEEAKEFDEMFIGVIRKQPELIRCKDCKYQQKEYHEDKRRKDGGYYIYWCEKTNGYSPLGFDNQYCSEAERKEE